MHGYHTIHDPTSSTSLYGHHADITDGGELYSTKLRVASKVWCQMPSSMQIQQLVQVLLGKCKNWWNPTFP
jgi:hypothetical protein